MSIHYNIYTGLGQKVLYHCDIILGKYQVGSNVLLTLFIGIDKTID